MMGTDCTGSCKSNYYMITTATSPNPLGKAIDGKGDIQSKDSRPLEVVAPGVIDRQSVDQPIQTGIKETINASSPRSRKYSPIAQPA
jgi:vacuolar-type H+-ATPase subunit B/Vma2